VLQHADRGIAAAGVVGDPHVGVVLHVALFPSFHEALEARAEDPQHALVRAGRLLVDGQRFAGLGQRGR
jgi:hypothetical protein